nr:ribonuclease H-like domain-containing protein [Tanacetum cinerariifolium]
MAVRNFLKFFRRKGKFVRQPREEKKSFRQKDEKEEKSDRKCFRCGDPNHLIGDYPKPPRNKVQKAFIEGSWSDSENDAEDKTKDELVSRLNRQLSLFMTNNYTIEFDAFGFLVKDFMTRRVLLRCNSTRDLHPVMPSSLIPHVFLVSEHTWHRRLGHPGSKVLPRLVSNNFISCNKEKPHVLCHACQLGKHARLSFVSYNNVVTSCFDIIQSNVWTSPIPGLSGFKYYIIGSLHQEFAMTDLGPLNYFLGISVTRDTSGLFLSHKKYAIEVLERAHMVNCNPSRTPVDTESKLRVDVKHVCLYMHDPREPHFFALKRILRLVAPLHGDRLQVIVYFLATTYSLGPLSNPVQHQRTKHIEIDIHFVRDLVAARQVRVLHVPSRYQSANIFTKGLSSALFEEFHSSLSVRCPPTQTAWEC